MTTTDPQTFTPAERAYIRSELDRYFTTLPTVAEGLMLRTWRTGPRAGQPKLGPAAQSLLGATFSGCGASYSGSFQNTKRDGCPAHVAKAPCSRGNVLAHARSRAEEVPEFVVTAAISSC